MNIEHPTEPEPQYIPIADTGGLPPRRARKAKPAAPEAGSTAMLRPLALASDPIFALSATPFPCPHCEVSLAAMADEFPGYCPACETLIPRHPAMPMRLIPAAARVDGVVKADGPSKDPQTMADLWMEKKTEASESATGEGATEEGATEENAPLHPRRPDEHRIERSGTYNFRPLSIEDIPNKSLDFEKLDMPPSSSPAEAPYVPVEGHTGSKHILLYSLAFFLFLGVIVVAVRHFAAGPGSLSSSKLRNTEPHQPIEELRAQINDKSEATLKAVLGSSAPSDIASHVIGGDGMLATIEERMKSGDPLPQLSEADVLNIVPMNDQDIRRGLGGILYEAAPDDALSLDSPLFSAGTVLGVEGLGLLEAGAYVEAGTTPEPRRALALFVKGPHGRMLLEWELFIQTWDRSLRAFQEGALGEETRRFRVLLSLDKPVFENEEFVDNIIIRLQDPIHAQDNIRIISREYDPAMIALRRAAAEAKEDPTSAMQLRTATVDLRRSAENGRIVIENFVCWEFPGLGGNTNDNDIR